MFTSIINDTLSSTIYLNLVGLPDYHNMALVALGLLLSIEYILSGSNCWEEFLESSLNMGIYPLLLSFSWIIIYHVIQTL
jgi:hypothetical protein